MRKAILENRAETIAFNQKAIDKLESEGYKYFQVKGFTIDNHYEHGDPYYILLVPIKSLPVEQGKKDIYESLNSEILQKWVTEENEYPEILITDNSYKQPGKKIQYRYAEIRLGTEPALQSY
jgi:hypothetical protein